VLINLYPVLLQRYNRPRVERLILRLEQASRNKSTEPSDAPKSRIGRFLMDTFFGRDRMIANVRCSSHDST